jgi:prepilin-type N-terminal cleavage/methylation domain-containing protein
MAQKYTILKVLIQHLNKFKKADKGFTLLELIFGLTIMVIVGGLAMNAFISASSDFNKDKKSIDSSQNLSAILEMIGNDIKQSGELISDSSFPTIEFAPNTDSGAMSGSSKVIIRRAVSDPLTLCQSIAANTDPTTLTTLLVADTTATTVAASANCNARTTDNPLLVVRPATVYPTSPATTLPGTKLALTLPVVLRKARDYRCKLDELNPTVAYDSSTRVAQDFCDSSALEKVRIAVSDKGGRMLIFNQTDETADGGNTADTVSTGVVKKYSITVQATGTVDYDKGMSQATIDTNTKNKTVAYNIGSPIYLLEERVYSLTSAGEFQVSVNGKAPATLIKKIANFRVSARGYTNATDGAVNPTPAADVCTNTAPFADQPATGDATVDAPQYICKFNYNALTSDPAMNWKMIAGVKIELHAKYDGVGGSSAPTTNDADKLKAAAEYFPRNVLSK